MDQSSARSERITAILSAVVAVVILAAGVTAHQSHNAPTDDLVQLESDLRFQLDRGFRHNQGEQQARLAQLDQVLADWQHSQRTDADRSLLADWLLEATVRSMPGSGESMPTSPQFGLQQPVVEVAPTQATVVPPVEPIVAETPTTLEPTPAETIVEQVAEPTANNTDPAVITPEPPVVVAQPVVATHFVAVQEPAEPVQINLTELAARIAGYHDGLDAVETSLLALESSDLNALSNLVRQLDEMTQDFRFVRLYYDALRDDERRSIAEPRSLRATLQEIERRVDRNQEAVNDDFLGEFDANYQRQITQLRKQLAAVAERANW